MRGLQELEIGIGDLATGMYVCRLDRPWDDLPFPMQGFLVNSDEQIALLQSHCRVVWIDVERSEAPDRGVRGPILPATAGAGRRTPEQLRGSVRHVDSVSVVEELPRARDAHANAVRLVTHILDDARAGHRLLAADVTAAVEPIVDSVLRSADAMFWLNALRKRDAYAYSHAINCGTLAAAFGRHLGFPAEMLLELASGGLLLDIGKAQLPVELLSLPGALDSEQIAQVRQHVELSLRIAEDSGIGNPAAYEMIRTHHERCDGSGYPDGLRDVGIPLFGRMAAIIDSFDAMTSERPHARAIARHDALQQIYRCRDTLFQGELVEQFIGCLGVYPTGSLVELSSGEVAVVMAQNPSRRLRPRVLLLTDAAKRLCNDFVSLDLMAQDEDMPLGRQINILRPLPTGAYGLDPAELYL